MYHKKRIESTGGFMKTEKNILIAFILNAAFSIFEFFGGLLTGSVAIISDAIHDVGDAISIGISYFFEKKSKKQPDDRYTFGYARYSVLGSTISTLFLLAGSVAVISNAISKMLNPSKINYNGMIILAVVGVIVNTLAAYFTHNDSSLNQRAVNLHMIEDVLGWIVVLAGAMVMKFTDFSLIDPILSVGVALFIFINAIKNLRKSTYILLEKAPEEISIVDVKESIMGIRGITDVHHIHLWSMDGHNNYATMHIVTSLDFHETKNEVRKTLKERGIEHITLEIESENEVCNDKHCHTKHTYQHCHHNHH